MEQKGMGIVEMGSGQYVTALGEYIIGRVERGTGQTEGGVHLADAAVTEKVYVESIGSEVDIKNRNGRALKKGDQILVLTVASIPTWSPIEQKTNRIAVINMNSVIGVIE